MKYTWTLLLLTLLSSLSCAQEVTDEWTDMLDPQLSAWEKFIGVPHTSVNLEGVEKSDDVHVGIPLGLGNDPLNVFTINAENVLVASGEIYGGLTTKLEYTNYHLKLKYKWGEKKWEPRLNKLRDAGILYHCTGPHGAFWNVWMRCLEMQIQEGDTGDFFALAGANAMAVTKPEQDALKYQYVKYGEAKGVGSHYGNYRNVRSEMNERPHGEWNEVELMTVGGSAIHIVNGKVVNVVKNAHLILNGGKVALDGGKIQLQSEGAMIYYKDLKIKQLEELPIEMKDLLRS